MMYNVYKSALLNISADDSNDARWGCFRARDPLAVLPMRLRLAPAKGEDGNQSQSHWLTPDSTGLFEAITKAPLARRAWVFQERQLSRRVLHFTSREVVWECCAEGAYFACENFPRGAPLPVLFGGRPKYQSQGMSGGSSSTGGEVHDTWDMLCRSYSEKKLSHAGDKAVALSGLAREFRALLPGDAYVAGMWKSLLPQSLLWKSADSSGRVGSESYAGPSWSWLSIDGPISDFPPRGTSSLPVTEVLDVATEPAIPSEPTASLLGAYLDLRCYLRPVEIKPDYEAKPWYMMAVGGGKDNKLAIGDGGMEVGSFDPPGHNDTFTYSFDMPFTGDSGSGSVSAYFLPVSIDGPDETSSTRINGLLVEPVGSELTTFKRVGTMSCQGTHCLPILYRARDIDGNIKENSGSTGHWNKLRSLLGESYDSWENIREKARHQKGVEDSPGAPPDDSRSPGGSNLSQGDQQPGITEAKTEKDGDQAASSADPDMDDIGGGMGNLHVSEGDNTLEPPVPTVNWEAFAPLERLYASDGLLIGSELEQHFSRMVARQIRLI